MSRLRAEYGAVWAIFLIPSSMHGAGSTRLAVSRQLWPGAWGGKSSGTQGKGSGKGHGGKDSAGWLSASAAFAKFHGAGCSSGNATPKAVQGISQFWACRGPGGCSFDRNPRGVGCTECVSCGLPWDYGRRAAFWEATAARRLGVGPPARGGGPTARGGGAPTAKGAGKGPKATVAAVVAGRGAAVDPTEDFVEALSSRKKRRAASRASRGAGGGAGGGAAAAAAATASGAGSVQMVAGASPPAIPATVNGLGTIVQILGVGHDEVAKYRENLVQGTAEEGGSPLSAENLAMLRKILGPEAPSCKDYAEKLRRHKEESLSPEERISSRVRFKRLLDAKRRKADKALGEAEAAMANAQSVVEAARRRVEQIKGQQEALRDEISGMLPSLEDEEEDEDEDDASMDGPEAELAALPAGAFVAAMLDKVDAGVLSFGALRAMLDEAEAGRAARGGAGGGGGLPTPPAAVVALAAAPGAEAPLLGHEEVPSQLGGGHTPDLLDGNFERAAGNPRGSRSGPY